MPKISKVELKVREQIAHKENHLTALELDLMTYTDRVAAVKEELKMLNALIYKDVDKPEEKEQEKGFYELYLQRSNEVPIMKYLKNLAKNTDLERIGAVPFGTLLNNSKASFLL